jgi:hypothetical protein
MATYANPVGKKDVPVPEMKVNVEVKPGEVVFQMPMQSDAKAQKKNQDALRVAKELAPACHGVLVADPTSLKLTLKRCHLNPMPTAPRMDLAQESSPTERLPHFHMCVYSYQER